VADSFFAEFRPTIKASSAQFEITLATEQKDQVSELIQFVENSLCPGHSEL
jgi:hypothetical protein